LYKVEKRVTVQGVEYEQSILNHLARNSDALGTSQQRGDGVLRMVALVFESKSKGDIVGNLTLDIFYRS
jgi:hypothetical protein